MKRKKIIIISVIVVIAILGTLFFTTGRERTDVYLKSFYLSNDGKTMTLNVGVSGSSGYVRKMKQTSGSMNYYYTFYSTFGINSKIGAKSSFEIELDQNVDEIYFSHGRKGYKKVLEKNNETGEWTIPNSVEPYESINSLKEENITTTELVKFDGVLYGKSNAMIDYAGGSESIGKIIKLIDSQLIPKYDGETNTKELLNALVFDKTDSSIVLYYNNVYTLFDKIK